MAEMDIISAKDKEREAQEERKRLERERKITENTGLVYSMVRRFTGRGCEMEDLFQIGMMGLIKAVDHFNEDYEVKFSTYAVPLITGEIKRYLRDNTPLHVSRSLKENGWKAKKAADELALKFGREATLQEIAAATELKADEIIMAMEANAGVESLYRPICGKDGKESSLMEQLADSREETATSDPEKEKVLDRMLLKGLLKILTDRERLLIRLRYFEERTQTETAVQLGVSQVQVSRLEKKVLQKLRGELRA